METLLITLFSTSIVLFIISFFKRDRNKDVEKQIENFSITLMQEIYQLKKKVKILEEEILIGQDDSYFSNSHQSKEVFYDRDQILSLYEDGHTDEEIEQITGLTRESIDEMLNQV